jgi:NAD(P)H-hydrate epimerase
VEDKRCLVAFRPFYEGYAMIYPLVSTANAKALDEEASAGWGLNPYALVEAAGRACADAFVSLFENISGYHHDQITDSNSFFHSFVVLAGKGNNAADALVMLKALILNGYAQAPACRVFAAQVQEDSPDSERTPLSEAMLAVRMLGVTVQEWDADATAGLTGAHVIIDGIAGTGLSGPLRGAALEMAESLNALTREKNGPFVISIDMPSGNFDGWQSGMPIVAATATLAIEPQKICLYTQAARFYAGTIIPINGIFPSMLIDRYREAELADWKSASARIAPVAKTAYKYERGLVEIRAGSPGAAGAARLAAMGAQAAGAGLVRLIIDPSLYPVIAPGCTGIMVEPRVNTIGDTSGETDEGGRFSPDAALLGPGWGRGGDRMRLLEAYLPLEERGLPLILDADAIALAQGIVFHGNTVLTPHPGEFAAYTGLSKDEILNDPIAALRRCAAEKQAYILLKGHVLYAASPDGRIGIIDGMMAALATGGSGDVLAGLCAAIAARQKPFDGYACITAGASLLIQAAESIAGTFFDPAELARAAAHVAGKAWLP